jgi:hypothetical protein
MYLDIQYVSHIAVILVSIDIDTTISVAGERKNIVDIPRSIKKTVSLYYLTYILF